MFLSGWGSSQVLPAQDFLKQTRLRDHRMHARSRSRLAYNHIYLLGRTCTMPPARVSQAGPIPCCLLVRRLTVCATTTSPHHQHAISQHATTTTTTASQQHTKHTIMPNHLVNHAATLRRHVTTPTRQDVITPSRHHAITQHTTPRRPCHLPPLPTTTTPSHQHSITQSCLRTITPHILLDITYTVTLGAAHSYARPHCHATTTRRHPVRHTALLNSSRHSHRVMHTCTATDHRLSPLESVSHESHQS